MSVIDEIAAERERQIRSLDWTADHDDQYKDGELAMAAACYAAPNLLYAEDRLANAVQFIDPWPWSEVYDKRHYVGNELVANSAAPTRRRLLVKAAALIVAEIERLDRRTAAGLTPARNEEGEKG